MKTIGLIGGMSWESTVTYYQVMNEGIKERMGGLHSAKILLYSVDFYEIEKHMNAGEWEKVAAIITDAAIRLEHAGADMILIGTNTIHKIAPVVQQQIHIPLLHIAQATADVLKNDQVEKAILLGTQYTMEQEFYKCILEDNQIETVIPEKEDREQINRIIFEELCLGSIKEESKKIVIQIIEKLCSKGPQAVILGCTELGLMLTQKDVPIALYDTTIVHAKKAVEKALS